VRATTIKCPECGAAVNAPADADVATCEYCGTAAQIQRRSTILQRPMPLRARAPGAPQLPVATSTKAIGAIGCTIIFLGILAGFAVPIVLAVRSCSQESDRKAALRSPKWSGQSRAVHLDLNGDGVEDIIGRVRRLKPKDELMVAAFDGTNGKRLWVSESLGLRADVARGPMAVTGGTVIVGDGGAGVLALNTADGVVKWRIRLNEVVDSICAGSEQGTALLQTKDKQLHPVAVADGALQSAVDGLPCAALPNDGPRADSDERIAYRWSNENRDLVVMRRIEGFFSDTALHHVPSGVTIALGFKQPGTRVPMIASYSWPAEAGDELDPRAIREQMIAEKDPARERELYQLYRKAREQQSGRGDRAPVVAWTAVVPGVDPLSVSAHPLTAEQVDLNGVEVVVAYELRETHHFRLTAFSTADGKRKWDIELPGDRPFSAVAVSPTHAMVSRWDGLYVFDLATGKRAYTID